MATRPRPLSPHLQVYRPMYTTVLSILHRGTGLVLSLALLLLTAWLVALATGREVYGGVVGLLGSPLGGLVLAGLAFAFWYHFCAGIRHLVFDAGRGLDRASARRSGRVLVVASVTLTIATLVAMFYIGSHS